MFMQKQNNEPFQKLLKEAYSNNNISALDTIQERYTYGHCMDLAIAFNRIYGFEIQTTLVVEENKLFIGHAWVIREDGLFLDVMGLYSDSTELKSFGDKVITVVPGLTHKSKQDLSAASDPAVNTKEFLLKFNFFARRSYNGSVSG